jgi:hypothetical protein
VFENRLVRRIFGPKRDDVPAGWRKLHNKKPRHLYSSPSIINDQVKEDEMVRSGSTNGVKRNARRSLVGKLSGKRPLGRPRCRWEDNIKMDFGEIL